MAPTPTPRAVDPVRPGAMPILAVATLSGRDRSLDFTKGALVVCMVVYHAVNYFRYDANVLRHLHFLPPSFIFIVGVLITQIYWPRARVGDTKPARRLFVRGLKMLVLFVVLNLLVHSVFSWSFNRALGLDVFIGNVEAIFLTGEQRASVFAVLLPISYVLLLASPLLLLSPHVRYALHGIAFVTFLICAIIAQRSRLVFNLDLVSMGLLGMVAGLFDRPRVEALARQLPLLAMAYVVYSVVLRFQYPTYLLNTIGVCLSLLCFYSLGTRFAHTWVVGLIAFLGTYSLVCYLVQIAILQILLRLARTLGLLRGDFVGPMIITFLLMVGIVKAVHALRQQSRLVDYAYLAIFA